MELGKTQPFASPEEALEHHGVKGMRWGVRKEEDSSGDGSASNVPSPARDRAQAQRNAEAKQKLTELGISHQPVISKARTSDGKVATPAKPEHQGIGGLSPTEKKALLAAGVGVVAIGGFVAYKHYAGGSLRPSDFDVSGLAKGPLSNKPLGALAKGHPSFEFKNAEKLMVDGSKGYADIRYIDGFPSPGAKARHDELIRTLDAFREKYPVLKNMNIEVAPMSQVHGTEMFVAGKSGAAVMALGKGEARVMYNDSFDAYSSSEMDFMAKNMIGARFKDSLGNHEMGHLLAVAHGEMPPSTSLAKAGIADAESAGDVVRAVKQGLRYGRAKNSYHNELFKKHGLSFKELSKLSPYAKTQPAEALAELSATFHTPELRAKMDPTLAKKAQALFDDMGAVA